MRLRQVALVAENLTPVRDDLFTLLGIKADFRDPGVGEFGLVNSVMAMGDTFLEVVSPCQENTSAGRLLERRGGDGGYMVLAQVDDIDVVSERVEACSVRKIWEIARPEEVYAFHVHPRDLGAAIVSFDQMIPPEEWVWGGSDWRQQVAANVGNIAACDIQADQPLDMARRWAEVFDRELHSDNTGTRLLLDAGSYINFVAATDGRGDGVSAVEFEVRDEKAIRDAASLLHLTWHGNEVQLCGTRLRFRF